MLIHSSDMNKWPRAERFWSVSLTEGAGWPTGKHSEKECNNSLLFSSILIPRQSTNSAGIILFLSLFSKT